MSQLYLADKLIASTEGSDIKYNEDTSVNAKIDEIDHDLMKFRKILTEQDDLNNIKEPGIYLFTTNTTIPQNAPFEYGAVLEVYKSNSSSNAIIQRATRHGKKGVTAMRGLLSGTWQDWMFQVYSDEPIHLNSDFPVNLKMSLSGTTLTITTT